LRSLPERLGEVASMSLRQGQRVVHLPTLEIRTISGTRGDGFAAVVHFSQTIKRDGKTFYWATAAECVPLVQLIGRSL
jgi:hypothetical protein